MKEASFGFRIGSGVLPRDNIASERNYAELHFIGWTEVTPERWLRQWSAMYPDEYDESEYQDLISRYESLSSTDYERIGRWKDNAKSASRWKPNVASVAYEIWMMAATKLPRCPADDGVVAFLTEWSERVYQDEYTNGAKRMKRFGLSRASTLLHFISGGRFPIFDSRVVKAVSRLLNSPVDYSVRGYINSYCHVFQQIADLCGTRDLRAVDKALFSYGAFIAQIPDTV
jgi:hypothetical protein